MIYYTLQRLEAYKKALEMGYLTGDKKYVMSDFENENSYEWMKLQMKSRLLNYNNEEPIWLWLTPKDINILEILENDYVLLEVNIKRENVLLSNFEAWHYVLNDWNFDDNMKKEDTWEFIFDKYKLGKFDFGFEDDELQGTTGKIDVKHIKPIKYFLSNI